MAEAKREKRVHNTVHDDSIWRQTINYELLTAKNWEKNWGFMREAYGKLHPNGEPERNGIKLPPIKNTGSQLIDPKVSGLPSKLKPGLSSDENPIVSDWLSGYNVEQIIMYKFPMEKYSSPATTSSEIGWKWGKDANGRPSLNTLEKFGKHAAGKRDVLRWWGGSRESMP